MTDYMIAGSAVALLTLVFSDTPFLQLVYVVICTRIIDWEGWAVATGLLFIAMMTSVVYRKLK